MDNSDYLKKSFGLSHQVCYLNFNYRPPNFKYKVKFWKLKYTLIILHWLVNLALASYLKGHLAYKSPETRKKKPSVYVCVLVCVHVQMWVRLCVCVRVYYSEWFFQVFAFFCHWKLLPTKSVPWSQSSSCLTVSLDFKPFKFECELVLFYSNLLSGLMWLSLPCSIPP